MIIKAYHRQGQEGRLHNRPYLEKKNTQNKQTKSVNTRFDTSTCLNVFFFLGFIFVFWGIHEIIEVWEGGVATYQGREGNQEWWGSCPQVVEAPNRDRLL